MKIQQMKLHVSNRQQNFQERCLDSFINFGELREEGNLSWSRLELQLRREKKTKLKSTKPSSVNYNLQEYLMNEAEFDRID